MSRVRQVITYRDPNESRSSRRERQAAERAARSKEKKSKDGQTSLLQVGEFPRSKMPRRGWQQPESLQGETRITPIPHHASTRVIAAAYPFLAESGEIMRGAYVGENMLSRSPFCFDPWEAYDAGVLKSHSMVVIGVKGTGKSMLAKSFSSRLCRLGRSVAVPHDPNGEWARVAAYVGGKSITVGLGSTTRINLLEAGARDRFTSDEYWRQHVMQDRASTVRAIVKQLRQGAPVSVFEHTAIDEALELLMTQDVVTVVHVFEALREFTSKERPVEDAARGLAHTLRRLVIGDLAGMFDGPSTVVFDPESPMMVVDTSGLKNTSPDLQALARMATSRWVANATSGSNRRRRLIVHEEAAIALMNDVYGGAGLAHRAAGEKVARHDGVSNCYLLHRIADLDALGDAGSANRTMALGLLADCETRVSYQQHYGEVDRSAQTLNWNQTISRLIPQLKKGEGLWQLGQHQIAMVRNKVTPREKEVFSTDGAGGSQ